MTTEPNTNDFTIARSWDTYWHGTGDAGAWSAGGVSHPAIRSFWEDYFKRLRQQSGSPAMLDIASGNGAVVERALGIFGDSPLDVTCLDVSEAAVANIRERFPGVRGVVADACSMPLESGGFDLVTSQFGLEYAGPQAIAEALRVLAVDGRMALMLHHRSGTIQRECAASLDAITRVRRCAFIPLASEMFRTGFAAVRGADRAPYEAAGAKLAPAVKALEEIIAQHGEGVAGDTIARLYGDVARIHAKLPRYDPDEVLEWLSRMEPELEAYAGRMSSMMGAALDAEQFGRICATVSGGGYSIERAEPLAAPGDSLPLAWVILAAAS